MRKFIFACAALWATGAEAQSSSSSALTTNNWIGITAPLNMYLDASNISGNTVLTINRKDAKCVLVIVEDTAEKLVIGCRKELAK